MQQSRRIGAVLLIILFSTSIPEISGQATVAIGSGVTIDSGTIFDFFGLDSEATLSHNLEIDELFSMTPNHVILNGSLAEPTYVLNFPFGFNAATDQLNITGRINIDASLTVSIEDILNGIKIRNATTHLTGVQSIDIDLEIVAGGAGTIIVFTSTNGNPDRVRFNGVLRSDLWSYDIPTGLLTLNPDAASTILVEYDLPSDIQINATILAVDGFPLRAFASPEIRVQSFNGTLTFVDCPLGQCTFLITNETVEFAVRAVGQFVLINGSRVISTSYQANRNVTFLTPVGAEAPAAASNFRPGIIALLEGDLIAAIQAPFVVAMGAWFYGILGLLPMLMIYLRSQSIGPPMIAGMILIAAFLGLGVSPLLPPEVVVGAYVVMAMMIAGLLYRLFKRED